MGIMDALRRAGHEGKSLARRSMDWGRHEAEDMQSVARRKWRINRPTEVAHDERRADDLHREVARRPIVSINGQDVNHLDPHELKDEGAAEANPEKPERDAA